MKQREHRLNTKDDRGREVSMLDPYTLYLLRRHDTIPAEELAGIADELGSGLTRMRYVCFVLAMIGLVPGVVALIVQLVRIIRAGGMVWPLPIWLPLANLWVVPFVLWISAAQIRAGRIRATMLAHRRCPHCGYDLRLLPVDPADGATVCPECGCAWKLNAPQE